MLNDVMDLLISFLATGINFIDVAPLYAEAEKRLGYVMKDISSKQRDTLYVPTASAGDWSDFQ